MKLRTWAVAGLIALGLTSCGPPPPADPAPVTSTSTTTEPPEPTVTAAAMQTERVTGHVDGDTIKLSSHGTTRLIGVDTPETVHPSQPDGCYGAEASAFLASLLPVGTEVRTVEDKEPKDRFGRSLVYLYRLPDGMFVNGVLVKDGYAEAMRVPPNTANAEGFEHFEQEARRDKRGMWGACG